MPRFARLAPPILLALSLLLGGCGFHLAGSDDHPLPEPLRKVRLEMVQPYRVSEPPVETALRTLLSRRGAEVLSSAGAQVTLIRLTDLHEDRDVLSIGINGLALEYQLTTRVRYEVLRAGQILVPEDEIYVTRSFSYNSERVLAKESEEQSLRSYMQNELAQMILLLVELRLRPADAAPSAGVPPAG